MGRSGGNYIHNKRSQTELMIKEGKQLVAIESVITWNKGEFVTS